MTIKLIIFDLDGVLIDSRPLHYHAFNEALKELYPKATLSEAEHTAKYDGLPTKKKLEKLTLEKALPIELYDSIWKKKQEKTMELIEKLMKPNYRLIEIMRELKRRGYLLYCASNSIWNTVKLTLLYTGLLAFIDYFVSNEEIKSPKPSADIYFHCMSRARVSVHETLICEDSPIGREAALNSGAQLCPIENPEDLTLEKLSLHLKVKRKIIMQEKWTKPINVIIPMAGHGSRFASAGYTFPKPLIEVAGKPMIQVVVENIQIKAQYIFIVQKEHYETYNLKLLLERIAPACKIVQVDKVTEGAACSVLLAKEHINNDTPLLIANSDQYLEWNPHEFLYFADSEGVDGCISTFYNTHPKWSYAKLNEAGFVVEVREKQPISTNATTGIYYWRHGSDFVHYAEQMIEKNLRVNNEFYICPVFNEAIEAGKKIKALDCKKMWGIGVPDDLQYFLNHYDVKNL